MKIGFADVHSHSHTHTPSSVRYLKVVMHHCSNEGTQYLSFHDVFNPRYRLRMEDGRTFEEDASVEGNLVLEWAAINRRYARSGFNFSRGPFPHLFAELIRMRERVVRSVGVPYADCRGHQGSSPLTDMPNWCESLTYWLECDLRDVTLADLSDNLLMKGGESNRN